MDKIALTKNLVVKFLGKEPKMFTRNDIIEYIVKNDIEMVNFMYPAGDGRLKTLNFVINDLGYLKTILTSGERVDGSSLFSFIEAGNSDLYVVPRYATAFRDPFAEIPVPHRPSACFAASSIRMATRLQLRLSKPCEKHAVHSTTKPGWNSRQWANLNTMSSLPTTGCFLPPTSAAITNQHHMPSSTNSARNACNI